MNKIINLIVDENNQNKRVDVFLSKYEKKISRTKIKNLIEKGYLEINNLKVLEPSKKVNIKDLHMHDMRHEANSRFFEKGLSIPEVALISGHKDVRMLFRYTHLKAEDILRKL